MNRAHGVLHARIRHLEAVGAETGERHRHGHLRLRARHELRGGNRGDFRQLRLRVLDDHLRVDREAEGERLRTQQVEGVLLAALQVLHDQSIVSPTVICIVPTVLGSKSMIAVRLALGRVGDETEANESTTEHAGGVEHERSRRRSVHGTMHLEGNHIRSFLHARGRVGRLRTVRGGGSANVACGRFQYQSVRKSGGRRAQVQIRGVRKNVQIIKTTVEHIARLRVCDRR